MTLASVLKDKDIVTCIPSDSLRSIAQLMKVKNVGAVVVTEHDKPVGLLTDRDIVLRCTSAGLDPSLMTAKEAMSSPVATIELGAGIYDLIDFMSERQVRRIVLVDHMGKAQNILSLSDILELLSVEFVKLVSATGQQRKDTINAKVA